MHSIYQYQEFISDYLLTQYETKEPVNLYEPIHYILKLGGKRMRPVLTLHESKNRCNYKFSCDSYYFF